MHPHVQYTWMVVSSQALEKKREEQRCLQEENMRINAETMRAKEQRREEEKLADRRDMEYIQKKLVTTSIDSPQTMTNARTSIPLQFSIID